MIKAKAKYIVLYTIGFILLIFGQRNFWEEIQEKLIRGQARKQGRIQ